MNHRIAFAAAWALVLSPLAAPASALPPRALVLTERPTVEAPRALIGALNRAGYAAQTVDLQHALTHGTLDGAKLVAIPDARRLPATLHAPLERHARAGGSLMVFGLPAWREPLLNRGDRWVSVDEYARAGAWTSPPRQLIDFSRAGLDAWTRSSDAGSGPTRHEIIDLGGGRTALHVTVQSLEGWDTLAKPLENPFPPGFDRTVFAAKGGPRTKSLAVEWEETDGSRWIATVPLTTQWRRYELEPGAFRYWVSNPNRGGAGDALRPSEARRFSVGLAFSHTGTVPGRHQYWIGPVGTARAEDAPISGLHLSEELDGIYPASKSFPVRDAALVVPSPDFPFDAMTARGRDLRSPHPRPSGAGYNKGRRTRFVTLLEARSVGGAWRGAPGAAMIHTGPPFKGGVWAMFGLSDPEAWSSPGFTRGIEAVARWMRGPLLAEAGSEWSTYFPGQPVTIGARLAGPAGANDSIECAIHEKASGRVVWTRRWPASADVSAVWIPPAGERGPWVITTRLTSSGQALDVIRQDVHVWEPSRSPRFITASEGRFLLDGAPWKAHGVNYMPSTGVGRDHPRDADEFEHWIGAAAYDAEVVARDLDHIVRMGMNSISIFIYDVSRDSGNLLDILRQCDERGLKVNLSLRPGTPLDFQWDSLRPIIEKYRLAENDVVFMYDLAWEPSWGNRAARAKYDARWTAWVKAKHGSLAAAEAAWGFTPDRDGGTVRNPEDAQTVAEGPWTKMVVEYRAFLNELLHDAYGRARDLVRSVDRNHLISFRMSETSNPTYNWAGSLNYDFEGLKDAVDLFAPEGYGRRGGWDATKPGWFQVAYARAVNPALPVIWGEAGENIWESGSDEAPGGRRIVQARQAEAFYNMLIRSGSNGVFWWWYPGGYRTNENSDFGIINPDGTDRPVTKVIREHARRFLAAPAPAETDGTLEIRTDDAAGLAAAYRRAGDAFWRRADKGRAPRLVITHKPS